LKTILIAGINGFLGSRIAAVLSAEGYRVGGLIRPGSDLARLEPFRDKLDLFPLEDSTALDAVKAVFPADIVINAAVVYDRSDSDPLGTLQANLLLPVALNQTFFRGTPGLFINFDSYFSYTNLKTMGNYILSKQQSAQWLDRLARGHTVYNLILMHLYGEADRPEKFIPFLINSLLSNTPELDLTSCRQKKDFLYLGDLADLLRRMVSCENPAPGYRSWAVGSGQPTPLREAVEIVRDLIPESAAQLNYGARPGVDETCTLTAEPETLKAAFGWEPSTSLREGLEKTVNYYRGMR